VSSVLILSRRTGVAREMGGERNGGPLL